MSLLVHCVYKLFSGRKLIYVGRSIRPTRRRRCFERKYGVAVSRQEIIECSSFEEAAALELKLMNKHKPPYNFRLYQSSPTRLGQTNSEELRAKISAANKGRKRKDPMGIVAKMKASGWGSRIGPHTEETKAKISATLRRNFEEKRRIRGG